jgi:hypothetical protein
VSSIGVGSHHLRCLGSIGFVHSGGGPWGSFIRLLLMRTKSNSFGAVSDCSSGLDWPNPDALNRDSEEIDGGTGRTKV